MSVTARKSSFRWLRIDLLCRTNNHHGLSWMDLGQFTLETIFNMSYNPENTGRDNNRYKAPMLLPARPLGNMVVAWKWGAWLGHDDRQFVRQTASTASKPMTLDSQYTDKSLKRTSKRTRKRQRYGGCREASVEEEEGHDCHALHSHQGDDQCLTQGKTSDSSFP